MAQKTTTLKQCRAELAAELGYEPTVLEALGILIERAARRSGMWDEERGKLRPWREVEALPKCGKILHSGKPCGRMEGHEDMCHPVRGAKS